jgi:VCBS repeat-containing protein
MSQTTIQQAAAIRKGSVKVQIGDSFNALVDIGAIRSPKLVSLAQTQSIEFDNVNSLKQFADGDKVQFSFTLAEINLTNLAMFDGGLITMTPVAAAPVTVTTESVTVAADAVTRLAHKNGDGTKVGSLVLTGKAEGTDYEAFVDAEGYTCLTKIGTGTFTVNAGYTYTPNASKKIEFNSTGTKTLKALRVINTDGNSKTFKIDIENCTNVQAPTIEFPADDKAEVATLPITLEGYLVEITDEQQVL